MNPGLAGTYLIAATLYASLSGRDPRPLKVESCGYSNPTPNPTLNPSPNPNPNPNPTLTLTLTPTLTLTLTPTLTLTLTLTPTLTPAQGGGVWAQGQATLPCRPERRGSVVPPRRRR